MSKKGFSPIIIVLAISVLALVPLLGTKSTTKYSNPSVKGVLIAKGDDSGSGEKSSGGGSDSGSGSGSGSHDSGGSSGGSSGSSGGSSGGSGGSGSSSSGGSSSQTTRPQAEIKVEKPEKREAKTELKIETKDLETETEVENETKKPEVERVEIHGSASGELEVETKVGTSNSDRRNRRGKTPRFTLNIATRSGESQSQIEVKAENGEIQFEFQGVGALTHFPLSFDKTTNTLTVNTPNGPKTVRVLPNQASEAAQNAGVENLVEKIELVEAATGSAETVVFKIAGKRTGNFLGLIPVTADVETEVGAQTGQILTTTEPFWLRLFGSLIR